MIALSFCPHSSFVQGSSHLVRGVLATIISRQFPRHIPLAVTTESEIQDAAWTFHVVSAYNPIFIQTHVIDHNSDDIVAIGR
jgi:hypothetical protein